MALSIAEIVRQFKADVAKALSPETVENICGYLGYVCRHRLLNPTVTLHVFLLQILHGNTACAALSRLAGVPFTAGQSHLPAMNPQELLPCPLPLDK
jgi:hypothetical protein